MVIVAFDVYLVVHYSVCAAIVHSGARRLREVAVRLIETHCLAPAIRGLDGGKKRISLFFVAGFCRDAKRGGAVGKVGWYGGLWFEGWRAHGGEVPDDVGGGTEGGVLVRYKDGEGEKKGTGAGGLRRDGCMAEVRAAEQPFAWQRVRKFTAKPNGG